MSPPPPTTHRNPKNHHHQRRHHHHSPESQLRFDLESCLRRNDLPAAISLFNNSTANINLSHHHFNPLLHLCALNSQNPISLRFASRLFDQMISSNIGPTEATITQLARLAVAGGDCDRAFDIIKSVVRYGITPRLRTIGPTLYGYCEKGMAERAYEVERWVEGENVELGEGEVVALLRVSAETGRGGKVYEYLGKLRGLCVGGVGEETARVVEGWFGSKEAGEVVGDEGAEEGKVREKRVENGGGWHGLGWRGKGPWRVERSGVDECGVCKGCGERLVCVDIECGETERFAGSIAALALEREAKANFKNFMDWIEEHHDYEAIVDGANVGLYQQNFADGGFSITQLDAVVRELYNRSQKWPLVVIHNKRLPGLQANPSSQKLLEEWKSHGVLYSTPSGSNDDWYWLYAAVKLKCLLVTNDEMRDHIFELLGSNFFCQWKERHQVRYTFLKGDLKLQMPPIYSIAIQESENGSWHIPISSDNNDESCRSWLCITRPSSAKVPVAAGVNPKSSKLDPVLEACSDSPSAALVYPESSKPEPLLNACGSDSLSSNGVHNELNGNSSPTRKRKDRSPSPCQEH
ncbi:Proteinaceous RNase P 3-like protein [Drosera capensis]